MTYGYFVSTSKPDKITSHYNLDVRAEQNVLFFLYRYNVHSDIHTVHSPTDAHLLTLWLQFTLKLEGFYMFRSTTIISELAIEPG